MVPVAGHKLPPEKVRAVLHLLAAGMNPLRASVAAGVSQSFAYQLRKKMIGGVFRLPAVTYSARYLDREERYEIARLREAGLSVRQVAGRIGRAPSTVSREVRRNADPAPVATSPSGRAGWPGSGSAARSRRRCRSGAPPGTTRGRTAGTS
jgi:hypothetical protein